MFLKTDLIILLDRMSEDNISFSKIKPIIKSTKKLTFSLLLKRAISK